MREKAKVRLICIIVAAVLAAFLVPLAAKAWLASPTKVSKNPTAGDGMYRYPALAARGSNVYAMWSRQEGDSKSETDPYYDKSSNDGLTWEEEDDINIQPSPGTETYAPLDLTIDSADRVHFVWVEVAGSSPTYTLYYSYTMAAAIQTISQTTQIALHPAVEVSSTVHVVWSEGGDSSDIWYASKPIGPGAWSGPANIHPSSSTESYHPDIAVDSNDDLHVVWEEDVDSGTILYQKWDGGWLTSPITLSTGIPNSHRPAIAVYSNTVNVVWCEYISGDVQYVRFLQSTDWGSTWAPSSQRISGDPLVVYQTLSYYLWPAIAVDINGKIHVAFNGESSNPAEDIHYVSSPDGVSWSPRWNVTNNGDNTTTPAIATAGNYVHLIWAGQSSGTLYDVYYNRAGILEEVKAIYLPLILKAY